MTPLRTVDLVLVWHMHQPDYRDPLSGEYRQPSVYLHAIKDYTDMAAHLERYPLMRAVVNFAPVLLEQLDDYAQQLDALLKQGKPTQDHMLNLLSGVERIPSDVASRLRIAQDCQRCHAPRCVRATGRDLSRLQWALRHYADGGRPHHPVA